LSLFADDCNFSAAAFLSFVIQSVDTLGNFPSLIDFSTTLVAHLTHSHTLPATSHTLAAIHGIFHATSTAHLANLIAHAAISSGAHTHAIAAITCHGFSVSQVPNLAGSVTVDTIPSRMCHAIAACGVFFH
jgi:hypothetical protein